MLIEEFDSQDFAVTNIEVIATEGTYECACGITNMV